eukprot:354837-Chlamydomonas_euryale.AAC.5
MDRRMDIECRNVDEGRTCVIVGDSDGIAITECGGSARQKANKTGVSAKLSLSQFLQAHNEYTHSSSNHACVHIRMHAFSQANQVCTRATQAATMGATTTSASPPSDSSEAVHARIPDCSHAAFFRCCHSRAHREPCHMIASPNPLGLAIPLACL